ncbi:MAG: GNAT family N-acetyltransferase [Clostridia bacterium]|nr:GNAT family N-acetyltransferase [Clostridia bacterium]
MERFYFEIPGPERKEAAIDYINEFYQYNSEINGTGGLNRFLDNYEGWLEKLNLDYTRVPNEEKVPGRTYFLVRESDQRIVGMINIRLALNEKLKHYGGHIGYSIRPTERGKGYNNINLYLGLKVCDYFGIGSVFMDADLDNPASWKTMEAMGGKRIREYYDDVNAHCTVVDYTIDVKNALAMHPEMEDMILPRSFT